MNWKENPVKSVMMRIEVIRIKLKRLWLRKTMRIIMKKILKKKYVIKKREIILKASSSQSNRLPIIRLKQQ